MCFEQIVLPKCKERKRSAHKLWIDMKVKGFNVSERQRYHHKKIGREFRKRIIDIMGEN